MASTPATDHRFLTELITRLDAGPDSRVTGADIAQAIGLDPDQAEPTVLRLQARGYIAWHPRPRRGAEAGAHRGLAVLPEGYRQVRTGLS